MKLFSEITLVEHYAHNPPRESLNSLPIVGKTFEFYRQLHLWIHLFPKVERHSLGSKLEEMTLELIEMQLEASEIPAVIRKQALHKVSAKLNLLKLLVRLALETKSLDQKKYLTLQDMLQEIGRMLGGWIRSLS